MLWSRSYLDQLFTRDVDQLDGRRDPGRLRRFFEAYARNTAGVVPLATVHGIAEIDRKTAEAYERLPRLYHLRDRNGEYEVGLIAELDAHRLVAIEVKATAAPRVDSSTPAMGLTLRAQQHDQQYEQRSWPGRCGEKADQAQGLGPLGDRDPDRGADFFSQAHSDRLPGVRGSLSRLTLGHGARRGNDCLRFASGLVGVQPPCSDLCR
jgi:hypothetical protein